jgi:hypothetical protein
VFHEYLIIFKIMDNPSPVVLAAFGGAQLCVDRRAPRSQSILEELDDPVLLFGNGSELLRSGVVGSPLGMLT